MESFRNPLPNALHIGQSHNYLELITRQAIAEGITAVHLLNLLGIDHDRYHNGGVQEAIQIALEDGDDAEWIQLRVLDKK